MKREPVSTARDRRPETREASWPDAIGSADGRRRRGERTRLRVFDAVVGLMRELDDMPTIARIVERAGVGMRTLYQHFPDTSALYAATFDHVVAVTLSTMPPVSPIGPLRERIGGFVERRAGVCEAWAPLWRVALRFAATDEAYRDRIDRITQILRARAQIVYSRELSQLAPARQTLLLDALMSLTDMEAWSHLRESCGRDVESAGLVWRFSIEAVFSSVAMLSEPPWLGHDVDP